MKRVSEGLESRHVEPVVCRLSHGPIVDAAQRVQADLPGCDAGPKGRVAFVYREIREALVRRGFRRQTTSAARPNPHVLEGREGNRG